MPSLNVFLDSSVIISALASPSGGSRKIFEAAYAKKIKIITSSYVIHEVSQNISKIGLDLQDLEKLLSKRTIVLVRDPSPDLIYKLRKIIKDPQDAPVIAGAVISGAEFLISLDKKHILVPKIKKALRPMKVLSPKDFWKWIRTQRKD